MYYMRKEILFVFILLTLVIAISRAQDAPRKKLKVEKGLLVILRDTTFVTHRDTVLLLTKEEMSIVRFRENPRLKSSRFYDSLAKKTSGRKFSSDVVDLIVKKKRKKEKLVSTVVKSEEAFQPYKGYTIGSIVFKAVDLVEGSVIDTLQKATSKFGKFINTLHVNTRSSIINQNLLFEAGDVVDPFTLADTERILRQLKNLRDARIYVEINKEKSDIVDVIVVTQDVSSIGVSASFSSFDKYRVDLYDVNILGYARQLRVSYFRNANEIRKHGYEITLRESNFFNTFIQGELQYTDNYLRQRTRLVVGRDFFAPEIKYAGGLDIYRTRENYYFEEYDTLEMPYTENSVDFWAGRSFEIKKRMNLTFAGRVHVRRFIDAPAVLSDSNFFFHDRTLYLGSVSFTKRNYLKSLRIRGFGRTEDIPIGGFVGIVAGKEISAFADRAYVELDGSFGKYYSKVGYLNTSLAIGSFFRDGVGEDGLITFTGTYFSNLTKVRKLQLRQFLYFNYIKGFNRVLDQTVTLVGKWRDDDNLRPLGNKRIAMGFETVYFMPWYTYGFQFALFHRFDLNLLADDTALLTNNTVFSAFRAGARMLNENLVLPAFSIEVAYYGKNEYYENAWEFRFSATLRDIFGTTQVFKPMVTSFN
jgi:hypothetical protein